MITFKSKKKYNIHTIFVYFSITFKKNSYFKWKWVKIIWNRSIYWLIIRITQKYAKNKILQKISYVSLMRTFLFFVFYSHKFLFIFSHLFCFIFFYVLRSFVGSGLVLVISYFSQIYFQLLTPLSFVLFIRVSAMEIWNRIRQ